MNWKFTGDQPVYQQICALIRGAVLTGELAPGQRIPSVREIAAGAQVNPNTVQRALSELERTGLLVSGGTSGRTVTQDQGILKELREDTFKELARACAEKFRVYGLSPKQAAKLLTELEEEES